MGQYPKRIKHEMDLALAKIVTPYFGGVSYIKAKVADKFKQIMIICRSATFYLINNYSRLRLGHYIEAHRCFSTN